MNDEKQLPPKDAMKEFQERVVADMQTKVGELLPPEALAELMKRAVDEQFFTPTKVDTNTSGWGSPRWEERPSWFVTEAIKVAEPLIKEEVAKLIEARKEEIQTAISEYLRRENLTILVFAALRAECGMLVQTVASDMQQRFQQIGR